MSVKNWTPQTAFAQLESCGYECIGGPLETNDAYTWLKEQFADRRDDAEPTVCLAGNSTIDSEPCDDPDCVCHSVAMQRA